MSNDLSDMTGGSITAVNQQSDISESIKQLFADKDDMNKIFQITDLSQNELSLVTRIWTIGQLKNISQFKDLVLFYCQIRLSRDRKSRYEVLRALEGANQQKGFLSNLNPMNWGRGGGR